MHRFAGLAVILSFLAFAPVAVADEDKWDFDLRGGFYASDVDGLFIGGGGLWQIGDRWFFNPNVEFAFGDDLDLFTLNGDFHYDFHTDGDSPAVWAGGGLALLFPDTNGPGDDDTEIGVNALVGIGAKRGSVRPFGQLKVILYDETEVVLMGGIRF